MKLKRIGVDLAKQVFQVHGVDSHEQVKCRKQLKRHQMLDFFRQLEPCVVAMEACGSAHYWARELGKLGHEVRLIAPQFVKPYVKGGKNDANDAQAICEAASRPTMRYVEVKTVEQQASQSVHRIRGRLIKARTALVNEVRGLLAEFGLIESRKGVAATRELLCRAIDDSDSSMPGTMRELLRGLSEELQGYDERLKKLEQLIQREAREDERQFSSARQFAAWLGLVPSQYSTGGKERLGGISKRGDKYLRTLLIHGSRSVLKHCQSKTDKRSDWLSQLMCRRNKNIATVALANKNARIIWAILSKGEQYQPC